jgi:type IV pilus assembly protein PilQ
VSVQDFTLSGPARLVIDVTGAMLIETGLVYDGVNRGGITNIRTAQYLPDVVRIVLDLESLRDYQIERSEDAIRISFGSDRTFAAWSSLEPRALAASASGGVDASRYELAAPPPVQGSQQPRITVTYDSASVADVMAGFAAFSGRSIILGKQISGYVTAEIKNQPWDVAFRSILESQGLSAEEESSGILRVDSREVLAARDSIEPMRTALIRVDYARAAALIPAVQAVMTNRDGTARGTVVADTATNSLVITDVESRIIEDSLFVSQLDIRTPQVSIHAKLIFVDRTDIENIGVRYDLGTSSQFFNRLIQRTDPSSVSLVDLDGDGTPETPVFDTYPQETNIIDLGGNSLSGIGNAEAVIPSPALQLVFSTAMGGFSLSTFVEALQQIELADLQAEPLITTSDNTEAEILVGERTPIRQIDVSSQGGQEGAPRATTEIVPTGINLRVTPHVTSGRQILMTIHAENSSIRAAPADVGFTFQTQEADNQILVNDGETAVIGGLTVTEVTVAKTGIPFLVDLPIIGKIFGFTSRREQRRDLLILVTPHIIDDASEVIGGN